MSVTGEFQRAPSRRHLMMTEAERRALAAHPETLTIYRGFNVDGRRLEMSWTLNADTARNFALRFGGHGRAQVASGILGAAAVIAYLRGGVKTKSLSTQPM